MNNKPTTNKTESSSPSKAPSLTASAAKSASRSASATSGHQFSTPLSRSQLSCLLRSEYRASERKTKAPTASTPLPLPLSEGEGSGNQSGVQFERPSTAVHEGALADMRRIDYLVLHCSDTRPDQSFTVEALQRCHQARGFGAYPGYHVYIRRDGTCYYTRPIRLKGCHVKDYNARSIGVCYEGGHRPSTAPPQPSRGREDDSRIPLSQCARPSTAAHEDVTDPLAYTPVPFGTSGKFEDNRTEAQKLALSEVLATLHELFPNAKLVGHNELNPQKACPCLSKKAMEEYQRLFDK